MMMVLGLLGTATGRWLAIGLVGAALWSHGWWTGDSHGDRQCAAAALENLNKKHAIEAEAFRKQLASAEAAAKRLAAHASSSEETISALQKQIDDAQKPGKPPDPNAVFDAQCRVTPAGRLRFK